MTTLQPIVRTVQFVQPTQDKRRVAAYARVSTDSDEQLSSYTKQVEFYSQYIQQNNEWEYSGIYTDEGITATSTKNRDGFNSMVQDALDGKIDLIITKSVSRFARNTVDSLNTIRELKAHGVEVFFERENIWTFDGKGELLLTIMSSLAQEESRNISENVKWGQRKRAAEGKVTLPYKRFLGYERGDDGRPQIVEKEAETIRLIYKLFLQGQSLNVIAKHLTDSNLPTPAGKKQWSVSTVNSILQNEKYKGDAILQKTFCDDFLTKKMVKNTGQVPQYYVEDSHPAIIAPEIFDMVQNERHKRRKHGRQHSGLGCFSSRIVCSECGGFFGSKVWHSNSPYRRTIWRCNKKYDKGKKCETPHVYDDDVKTAFVKAFNVLVGNREKIKQEYNKIVDGFADTSVFESTNAELCAELDVVEGLIAKAVQNNASTPQDQTEYNHRYSALTARYKDIEAKIAANTAERSRYAVAHENASQLLDAVSSRDVLTEFDETAWYTLVDNVIVDVCGGITVTFKDGQTILS
jgi:DNA invertase Pin-like site-specific DNA recombinase